jgi:hypothetical protein
MSWRPTFNSPGPTPEEFDAAVRAVVAKHSNPNELLAYFYFRKQAYHKITIC